MSDAQTKTADAASEAAAPVAKEQKSGGATGLRTNERLRQKYYVDEKMVISSVPVHAYTVGQKYSRIIKSPALAPAAKPVVIRCNRAPPPEEIKVEVVRANGVVSGIRINCPCGRHAELNFEYKSEK